MMYEPKDEKVFTSYGEVDQPGAQQPLWMSHSLGWNLHAFFPQLLFCYSLLHAYNMLRHLPFFFLLKITSWLLMRKVKGSPLFINSKEHLSAFKISFPDLSSHSLLSQSSHLSLTISKFLSKSMIIFLLL